MNFTKICPLCSYSRAGRQFGIFSPPMRHQCVEAGGKWVDVVETKKQPTFFQKLFKAFRGKEEIAWLKR